MFGNRPSSLPVAQFCGLAPRLAAEHGAGNSARLSKVFHAKCAGALEPHQWEALTDDEQKRVDSWHKPGDIQPLKGPLLRYDDAHKELEVAVTRDWALTTREADDCFLAGTLDYCWVVNARDGTRVVFVADIKKSRYASEGPLSLQLLAYAWMACAHFEADAYCPGLWIAEEGFYSWAERIYLVDSKEALRHLEQVEAAALNKGEAVTGGHCMGCYQRMYCPEWTAPHNDGILGPALAQDLSEENALTCLLAAERLKETAELAIDNIKAAVLHGKVTIRDQGKVYRAANRKGKVTFSQKLAREELGEEAMNRYMRRGSDYTEFRWVKEKP